MRGVIAAWGSVAALAVACGGGVWAGAEPAERPNVVLIMADDLGFSDIGSYGSEIETPREQEAEMPRWDEVDSGEGPST